MSIAAGNTITWADITNFYAKLNSAWRSLGAYEGWNDSWNPAKTPSGGGQGNLATAATMNNLAAQIYDMRHYRINGTDIYTREDTWKSWIGGTYPSTSMAAGTLITAQPWQKIYNGVSAHQCSYSWNGSNRDRDNSEDTSEGCSNRMK